MPLSLVCGAQIQHPAVPAVGESDVVIERHMAAAEGSVQGTVAPVAVHAHEIHDVASVQKRRGLGELGIGGEDSVA